MQNQARFLTSIGVKTINIEDEQRMADYCRVLQGPQYGDPYNFDM